jgi:hypothetical protein
MHTAHSRRHRQTPSVIAWDYFNEIATWAFLFYDVLRPVHVDSDAPWQFLIHQPGHVRQQSGHFAACFHPACIFSGLSF